jgi:UDP-N-acetylglucosamine 2-epimerase
VENPKEWSINCGCGGVLRRARCFNDRLLMKALTVFGTRPEAIKLAPLIKELETRPHFQCRVCTTGQHRQLLDQVLQSFQITPHHDLAA